MDSKKNRYIVISGYVRYRPKGKTFYLMANSRLLAKYLFSRTKKIHVRVFRDNEFFVIKLDNSGNLFKPREKEIVTCISGRTILKDEEINTLKDKKTKFSFPVKIKLDPSEFKLDRFFFYPDKDASALANSLYKRNIELPERIMTPRAFDHDIEFNYKDKRVLIEITQVNVSKSKNMNFKHQPVGGNIRAHIFDIYRKGVNSKLSNKDDIIGFIIINKDWRKFEHIRKLIPELSNLKCHIIFSDFKKNWNEGCSDRIIEILNNHEK